jgi:hypothetical protein
VIDSPVFRMADDLADGNLAGILREMRAERKSLSRIARELHALHRIDVTPQTVGNWCDALGIEKPDRPVERAS